MIDQLDQAHPAENGPHKPDRGARGRRPHWWQEPGQLIERTTSI